MDSVRMSTLFKNLQKTAYKDSYLVNHCIELLIPHSIIYLYKGHHEVAVGIHDSKCFIRNETNEVTTILLRFLPEEVTTYLDEGYAHLIMYDEESKMKSLCEKLSK